MRDVLRLSLVGAAIALPDSITPSLILTSFHLAAGPTPVRRSAAFAIAMFAVTFLGGVLIALGLGDLVRSLLPRLGSAVKYGLIIAGGVSLGLGGIAIWFKRDALTSGRSRRTKSSNTMANRWSFWGCIAGGELLTAFPYFAAITIHRGLKCLIAREAVPARDIQPRLYPAR